MQRLGWDAGPQSIGAGCYLVVREAVGLVLTHDVAPPRAYRPFPVGAFACEDLDMHHVVDLGVARVVVRRRVEDQVPREHLLLGELLGQGVVLVTLVPTTDLEAELLGQVPLAPPYQPTAVEE